MEYQRMGGRGWTESSSSRSFSSPICSPVMRFPAFGSTQSPVYIYLDSPSTCTWPEPKTSSEAQSHLDNWNPKVWYLKLRILASKLWLLANLGFVWFISRVSEVTNLFTEQKQTHRLWGLTYDYQGVRVGGRNGLGVWDWRVHTAIFKIDNQQGPTV